MKNILFVSPFAFDNNAIAIRIKGLSNELGTNNKIYFLTSKAEDLVFHEENTFILKIPKIIQLLFIKKHKNIFERIYYRVLFFISRPDYYILTICKLRKMVIKLDSAINFDAIIIFIFPFSYYFLNIVLPHKIAQKTILDIGDPFSNNAAYKEKRLKRIKQNVERKALVKSNFIIVTNKETKQYFIGLGVSEKKIGIIGQGVDKSFIANVEKDFFYQELKLIYAGAFYPRLRDPEPLIMAVQQIAKDIILNIYGDSFFEYKNINSSIIRKHESIKQESLIERYNQHNLLVFIDNAFGIQTPGKFWELLALNIPILFLYTDPGSPLLQIARKYSHIIVCKNQTNDIKQHLLSLFKSEIYTDPIESCDLITWEKLASTYQSILNELT